MCTSHCTSSVLILADEVVWRSSVRKYHKTIRIKLDCGRIFKYSAFRLFLLAGWLPSASRGGICGSEGSLHLQPGSVHPSGHTLPCAEGANRRESGPISISAAAQVQTFNKGVFSSFIVLFSYVFSSIYSFHVFLSFSSSDINSLGPEFSCLCLERRSRGAQCRKWPRLAESPSGAE